MAEKLTPQQAQAVRDRGGKLLVSAAAGSGKPKVLVDRLMGYLTDETDPANLDEFLIITYTKAAAAELRGKIAAKLTQRIAQDPENRHLQQQLQRLYLTKISTVHSFCSDILREYAYRLDLPADFRVGDENECRELRETALQTLLDSAYETVAEDPDFQAFVDTQGLGRDDRLVPEIIQKVYDSAKCHLDPKAWLDNCLKSADVEDLSDASQTLWGKYLMEDLFTYLNYQITAMDRTGKMVEQVPGLEKPAALLRDTLNQLRRLGESKTWDEVVSRRDIDYGRLNFPRKYDDEELKGQVKAVRERCKKGLEKRLRSFTDPSSQILADLDRSAAAVRGLCALVRGFEEAFDRLKRSRHVLDFSDLEHKTLDLLLGKSRTTPTAAAREISKRFREIMVDEYQDSNAVQDAIFSALTEKQQNLFMVGDVKQSIYQFRLADPGIFLEKYHAYADADHATPGEGRRVMLSANFRSAGGVVEAVNHVFSACMSEQVGGLVYGENEALREGIPHIPNTEPEVELHTIDVKEDTYGEEAAFAAQRVCELLDGSHMVREGENLRPIRAEDIVILLRSPGSVGVRYQRALEERGIRCTSGGGTDLLKTPEIAAIRSLLQTVSNPRQDIPLIACLVSPVFGFTADDLAAFRSKSKFTTVYDALLADDSEKARNFLKILAQLRQTARRATLPELLEQIFAQTRIDSLYAAMDAGQTRADNLQTFYQLAVDFQQTGRQDLNRFLDHLDAMAEKGLTTAGESASGAVTIMSIHKSKGLEFPVVFLCGLSREFNRESQRAQVLCDRQLGLGLSCVDAQNRVRYPSVAKRAIAVKMTADSLSEELRVLYVALTRPKDRLIMTYASQSLRSDLQDLTQRMDLSPRELLTGDISCPGQWVLLAALQRIDAGELFSMAGLPRQGKVCEIPWKITVSEAPISTATSPHGAAPVKLALPEGTVSRLGEALSFHYAHTAATQTPSKQTATQRKGRVKDQEISENASIPREINRSWRKPAFREKVGQGKAYGSAIHAALQYIRYEACTDTAAVKAEVERLVTERFITREQGDMVNCAKIARFFAADLGIKMRTSPHVLREFKFSILDEAGDYGEGLEGEQVLLQGVVDCALIEDDGITIVDFKTDYVTAETLDALTERYRPQVKAYADAMERIYQMPIKGAFLYFFHLDRFVPL